MRPRHYLGLAVALLLCLGALTLVLPGTWTGADAAAAETIASTTEGFQPWASPVWAPPSGELESLLFAIQAAAGGLVIGYVLGRFREPASTGDGPKSA